MGGELLAPGNGSCYWHVSLVSEPGEPRAPSSLLLALPGHCPLTHMESLQGAATPTWLIHTQPPGCTASTRPFLPSLYSSHTVLVASCSPSSQYWRWSVRTQRVSTRDSESPLPTP